MAYAWRVVAYSVSRMHCRNDRESCLNSAAAWERVTQQLIRLWLWRVFFVPKSKMKMCKNSIEWRDARTAPLYRMQRRNLQWGTRRIGDKVRRMYGVRPCVHSDEHGMANDDCMASGSRQCTKYIVMNDRGIARM